MSMNVPELKQALEKAINDRLDEFKDRSTTIKELNHQLDYEQRQLFEIAQELKDVEYMIRASGNDTYADFFDELLKIKPKKGK